MLAVIVDQPSICLKPATQINERQYRRIQFIASLYNIVFYCILPPLSLFSLSSFAIVDEIKIVPVAVLLHFTVILNDQVKE